MKPTSNAVEQPQDDAAARRSLRHRIVGVVLFVLLVVVLALIPPLLNVSRVQRRIAASMSDTLGRPVHLDNVTLHILPVPGFTLENLVVNEDPAFGFEPTIRAEKVEVRLRAGSLWRRHVELSRIHFVEPSLNLVRNAQGKWNLESLLMHAAQAQAAPTSQAGAGSAPRFPYIEATGARVNLKLADEKMPFSLTEADFALWLPGSNAWHVRLVAKPSRTDANVADPGLVRVEGTFQRAPSLGDVPVDLRASWHNAPLGEATRLLIGNDAGWRGTVHLDLALRGLLRNANMTAKLTLNELRRADFVPAQLLDVFAECEATAEVTDTMLHDVVCKVPTAAQPLLARSAAVDLQHPARSPFLLESTEIPVGWALGWLKLLSPRIPGNAEAAGTVALHAQRDAEDHWTGHAALTLNSASLNPFFDVLDWQLITSDEAQQLCHNSLILSPTLAHIDATSSLLLDGKLSLCGYALHAVGSSNTARISDATKALPFLDDGLFDVLPKSDSLGLIDVTCIRTSWSTEQSCTANNAQEPPKKPRAKHR